jgi:hypothetical protein
MRPRVKGLLLLAWVGLALGAAASGRGVAAAALGAGALVWLAWEARRRQHGYFAGGAVSERHFQLASPALAVDAVPGSDLLLLSHPGARVSLFDLRAGRPRWERGFSEPVLAAVALADGRLLWAGEDRLHLSDGQGVDQASLAFQAPLLRQSYRLSLSADGRRALLSTPWLALVAHADLSGWLGSVRWEDAGHYLKLAALAPDGSSLLMGGALLLDEAASGGGATQGRWGLWQAAAGAGWPRAWGQSAESYANTHLRGLRWLGPDRVLVELEAQGREFRVLGKDGSLQWSHRGEQAVASPGLGLLAFEQDATLQVVGIDGAERWRWAHQEQLRSLRLSDDGSALALEGMHLRAFDASGRLHWTRRWRRDPSMASLLPQGAVAVDGARLSLLRLPGAGPRSVSGAVAGGLG